MQVAHISTTITRNTTILYAGEEQSASHTGLIKIGEVEDKNQLSEIKNLGSNIRLTVSSSI